MDKNKNAAEETAEIHPKITEFLNSQIKAKVKSGVDFLDIMKKLRARKAKRNAK